SRPAQPVTFGTCRDWVWRAALTTDLAAFAHCGDVIVSVPAFDGLTLNVTSPLELVLPVRLMPGPAILTVPPLVFSASVTSTVVTSLARSDSDFGVEMQPGATDA